MGRQADGEFSRDGQVYNSWTTNGLISKRVNPREEFGTKQEECRTFQIIFIPGIFYHLLDQE